MLIYLGIVYHLVLPISYFLQQDIFGMAFGVTISFFALMLLAWESFTEYKRKKEVLVSFLVLQIFLDYLLIYLSTQGCGFSICA